MFTIGYQGNTAVVDRNAKFKYLKATMEQLLDAGLFKPAFCSAIFSGDAAEMEAFMSRYREVPGNSEVTVDALKRLFGVFEAPEKVQKVLLV